MTLHSSLPAELRPKLRVDTQLPYRLRQRIITVFTHVVLIISGILWMYPFLWTLGGSLKTNKDFFDQGLNIFPHQIAWDNYANSWNEANFGQYFFNTIIVTVTTVIVTVIVTSMAGYVLARRQFPGKPIFIGLVAITVFLPHGYTIIPVFDIVQRLGLLNSLSAVILVQIAGNMVFNTFLFMGYFSSMEHELEDAARVDGAGFNQLFWRVMFPLGGPMIATVALFTFIGTWNSFFIPLVFTIATPELRTLAVGMYAFIGQNSTNWTYLCAGSVITLGPIMLVFIILQRYFINGVAGAIKS